MSLKTDYKDYIPATTLRKYQQITNADGTVSFQDVTVYTQVGDKAPAATFNDIGTAVNAAKTAADAAVPNTRKVNNKVLSADITLNASDVGAANKSTTVAATLTAAGWTGTAAPYSQTIAVAGVTTTSVNEILPSLSITADQLTALQSANLQDGSQASGNITVKAYGDKPTIDLPIRVIMRGDM